MAVRSQKPLPAIPRHSLLPQALSVEARTHLRRFIEHSLTEYDQCFPSDNSIQFWADALQDALEELGSSIARGGWLRGVKRRRKAQKARRDAEPAKDATTVVEKSDKDGSTLKGTSKSTTSSAAAVATEQSGGEGRKTTADTHLALEQIRKILSRPVLPTPKPAPKHLLLSLNSRSTKTGNDTLQDVGCSFNPSTIFLPETEPDESCSILYGLNEWNTKDISADGEDLQMIGGTFSFKYVSSVVQRDALTRILRVSVYMYLSLMLEQAFLINSNVHLYFPKPEIPSIPSVTHRPVIDRLPTGVEIKPKRKNPFLSTGLLSFFSKKTEDILYRTSSISPILGRGSSLDIARMTDQSTPLPRVSEDSIPQRIRRFSIISDGRSSPAKVASSNSISDEPFSAAVKRIEKDKDCLSTSAGVEFLPPALLVSLAEKEKKDQCFRLKGDEKTGLGGLLGWDGKDALGKGMAGILGFVRHQCLSTLYSQHVTHTSRLPEESTQSSSLSASKSSSTCLPMQWKTYRYYAYTQDDDKSLGDSIVDFCSYAELPCHMSGCQFTRGEHELRWIHANMQIALNIRRGDDKSVRERDSIELWQSCSVCEAQTTRQEMSDGTYLFSFAKFLEELVYSPSICTLTPQLCEHTTPTPRPRLAADFPLPRSRFNIIRHFAFQTHHISFSLSTVDSVFELRVPRLQILRPNGSSKSSDKRVESATTSADEEKRALRREIKAWWQGMAEHIEQLERTFNADYPESFRKSLPRLPSEDDEHDDFDSDSARIPRTSRTSTAGSIKTKFAASESSDSSHIFSESPRNTPITTISSPTPDSDPVLLLFSLCHAFQGLEHDLYSQLTQTPIATLNDVRRSFFSCAHGASRRLLAWQKKHLPSQAQDVDTPNVLSSNEPEWWKKGCHAVPGANVIVREDDWGSIISFTLSSSDFQRELASIYVSSARPAAIAAAPPSPAPSSQSSYFLPTTTYKFFTSPSHTTSPDPDQEGVVWYEPEEYSAIISRKEHPRDPTPLLSLREVLRQKGPAEGSSSQQSKGGSGISIAASKASRSSMPPTAWAKPAVEVSMQAADGVVHGLPESAGKILQEIDAASELSRPSSALDNYASSSDFVESHIRRGKASSIISTDSDTTVGPETTSSHGSTTPQPPPKDEVMSTSGQPTPTQSYFTGSITSSLVNAMRYVISPHDTPRPSTFKNQHGLLSMESLNINERPHIKYDWTIGKRLRFSCTVYYAKQFDSLRRRCGLEDVFLKSLGRSMNWAAEGGKSRSNFWKTTDDRFIIKTLVNAWNVADLQVLIELAPSYFKYMDATASRPTVLAKLLGFYTVEIRNVASGTTQAKADLLVMENLFYDQKIAKTFDLKGIQGRKVKPGPTGSHPASKTLFDGEWIEGQQRTLMLVHSYSKIVLREAVKRDAEFLAQSNIMDYSLLLGIDEHQKQIVCGLVDTIGSYTFAKTLEYKAKQGLNANKEVTVVPPNEYRERFVNAIENYFVPCPDKWSRPLDATKLISDPNSLPGVL